MEYIWLSISIFCNADKNYLVLNQGILPEIRKLQADGILKHWHFEFNNDGGANIRIPLLVKNSHINDTVKDIATYFKSFFALNGEAPAVPVMVNDLYGPFPPDSIQFGLYSVKNLRDNSTINLRQTLSEIYVKALCGEPVQEESLLSLSLYLYLIAIREIYTFNQINGEIREFFSTTGEEIMSDARFREELHNLLDEILEDLNSGIVYNDDLAWLIEWENVFKSYAYCNNYLEIFRLINQHLQLSEKILSIVIYLIRHYITKRTHLV